MKTDKTTSGDLRILLAIIGVVMLIWGFFKYKNKVFSPSPSPIKSQVNK
jgi:hypothetical protein